MDPLEQYSKLSGFIGAVILSKDGQVLNRAGDEFEVKPIFAILQDTCALVQSGAVGNAALKKITGA